LPRPASNGHILVVKALLDSFTDVKAMKAYVNFEISAALRESGPAAYYAEQNKYNEIVALLRKYAAKE